MISFGICSAPKESKYVTVLLFVKGCGTSPKTRLCRGVNFFLRKTF